MEVFKENIKIRWKFSFERFCAYRWTSSWLVTSFRVCFWIRPLNLSQFAEGGIISYIPVAVIRMHQPNAPTLVIFNFQKTAERQQREVERQQETAGETQQTGWHWCGKGSWTKSEWRFGLDSIGRIPSHQTTLLFLFLFSFSLTFLCRKNFLFVLIFQGGSLMAEGG